MNPQNDTIRFRIETLLRERGKQWADIYNHDSLRWHVSFASRVLNGIIIPPLWQRVALAKVFEVDSSVIWSEAEIITAYEMQKQEASQ